MLPMSSWSYFIGFIVHSPFSGTTPMITHNYPLVNSILFTNKIPHFSWLSHLKSCWIILNHVKSTCLMVKSPFVTLKSPFFMVRSIHPSIPHSLQQTFHLQVLRVRLLRWRSEPFTQPGVVADTCCIFPVYIYIYSIYILGDLYLHSPSLYIYMSY